MLEGLLGEGSKKKFHMLLLGDSHTRSYASSRYLDCVFVGSGKENNLSSTLVLFIYVFKLFILKHAFKHVERNTFGLVVGEPDLRFALYGDAYEKDRVRSDVQQQRHTDLAAKNCKRLISLSRAIGCEISFLIGSGTPNETLLGLSRQLNARLETIAGDLPL